MNVRPVTLVMSPGVKQKAPMVWKLDKEHEINTRVSTTLAKFNEKSFPFTSEIEKILYGNKRFILAETLFISVL